MAIFPDTPKQASYDVVIVGGAIHGSSTAWWLTENPDFDGSVLVVEMDPSYSMCSTAHTNSCIRQQYSNPINVRISQFGAEFIKSFKQRMGGGDHYPQLSIQSYGYMYLASDEGFADTLRASQKVQVAAGAATQLMTADEIKQAYPFYNVDDIILGSINLVDEGYWEGHTVFDGWRRSARERGVEYVANKVVAMTLNADGSRVESVTLGSGQVISCGQVVNASGPRAVLTSRMAGIEIPVEPRKRFTWSFTAEKPLDQELPLTIDPSGVHMRQDGKTSYIAGGHREVETAVDYDDFEMDHTIWEEKIWPAIAARVPAFEAIRVQSEWAGHYAYNVLDHNAILGPHDRVGNFIFQNGFSGHGLQQSPAMGRGISELLTYGEYRTLDLTPFSYDRIVRNEPFPENRDYLTIEAHMKKLVLTGAAGRLGSYLREPLSNMAETLVSTDQVDDIGRLYPGEVYRKADVGVMDQIMPVCEDADMIVHFGNIPDEAPFDDILHSNIIGSYNVWEAAHKHGVRRVVYASSVHAVGMHPTQAMIDTDAAHRPDTYYGLSKCFTEDLARMYWEKRQIEAVCLRIFSCADVNNTRSLGTWLSYDDLIQLVTRSIDTPVTGFQLVYGISNNDRAPVTNRGAGYLGYRPKDNAEQFADKVLAEAEPADNSDPAQCLLGGAFAITPLGSSGQALMNIVGEAKKA